MTFTSAYRQSDSENVMKQPEKLKRCPRGWFYQQDQISEVCANQPAPVSLISYDNHLYRYQTLCRKPYEIATIFRGKPVLAIIGHASIKTTMDIFHVTDNPNAGAPDSANYAASYIYFEILNFLLRKK